MSKLNVEVVRIGEITKHSNADNLSITKIYDYPVVIKSNEYKTGDIAIYFPIDSVLPNHPIFSFVWGKKIDTTEHGRTVKAIRLRGYYSQGLLIPYNKLIEAGLLPPDLEVGSNVVELIGVHKYEPSEPISMGGNNESTPAWFHKYTDIENARKYASKIFTPGEKVIITEKTHGCNARYAYVDGKLWVGSHNNTKKLGEDDVWNKVATKLDIINRVRLFPNYIFYGEIFGQVQKGFNYGLKPGECSFILFDVFGIEEGTYLDNETMIMFAHTIELPCVPILYKGPYQSFEHLESLATGNSMIRGANNIREGVVIKPEEERRNDEIGRCILKLHNPDYLIATGKAKQAGPAH